MGPVEVMEVTYRLLRGGDVAGLEARLGPLLAAGYPVGGRWLADRLAAAVDGRRVHAHVAEAAGVVVGVAVVSPRSASVKLSCLWVAPEARDLGVASALVDRATGPYPDRAWYLTVPVEDLEDLEAVVGSFGFGLSHVVEGRYGPGRDEAVMARGPVAAPDVRALSLSRPWTELVLGPKSVENRTWTTRFRGLVVIHAAKSVGDAAGFCAARRLEGPPSVADCPTGYLGVARLVAVDCHARDCAAGCSPWAMDGQWHWRLVDRRRFPAPIGGPGRVGLWRPAPDVVAAAVAADASVAGV